MKVFVQNSRCPSQVLFAFDDVADSASRAVRWAVAYTTRRGCEWLVNRVAFRMGFSVWERCDKHFITSLDFGLTEPDAIEYLSALPNSRVNIANPAVAQRRGFFPGQAYHPKMYLFDTALEVGFVVGSANLTDAALVSNTEVVVCGREEPESLAWPAAWVELLRETSPLSAALLQDYRRTWARPKKRLVEPDPTPPPPTIAPLTRPILWEAVQGGSILPSDYAHFWVEAGSMSSGGSHNQLELPRTANRYFGFTHTNYGDAHVTIGHPTLTIRSKSWTDRPLTWHGNNRMERINLPTLRQGGFVYQNMVVLFRRHAGGFEIHVWPWNDNVAVAWRAASDALGTIFRLGERGPRICGFF